MLNEIQYINLGLTALSGVFGVGVGVGIVKHTINKIVDDVSKIKIRQSKLRGNGGNDPPLFIRRTECYKMTQDCHDAICDELKDHSQSIRAFENYARWQLQKEGLSQQEINEILRK